MITQFSCNVFIRCFSSRLLVKCETSCVSHSHWECESVRKWEGWLSTVSPQVWMSVAGQNVIHKHTCHASYCYLNLSGYCDLLWYRLSLSPVLTYQLVAICSSWYQICCPMSIQAVLSSSDEISSLKRCFTKEPCHKAEGWSHLSDLHQQWPFGCTMYILLILQLIFTLVWSAVWLVNQWLFQSHMSCRQDIKIAPSVLRNMKFILSWHSASGLE